MIAATGGGAAGSADAIVAALPDGVRDRVRAAMRSTVGGGSPAGRDDRRRSGWPSPVAAGRRWHARLRTGEPAVVGRIEDGAVVLDLRTVDPADERSATRSRRRPCARAVPRAMTPMTVVIGTAGHIDHGKTTLLRALTGIDADRLPEERRRGMTIDVGYAHLALPDGTALDFVDVPGHDRLVGNMLVGAGEIDAAMLVVAADDGPRAQTIEHLALLDALGIATGWRSSRRRMSPATERTARSWSASSRLLDGTSLAGSPVVAVSSVDGDRDRRAAIGARRARRIGVASRGGSRGRWRPGRGWRSTASSRSRAGASW